MCVALKYARQVKYNVVPKKETIFDMRNVKPKGRVER